MAEGQLQGSPASANVLPDNYQKGRGSLSPHLGGDSTLIILLLPDSERGSPQKVGKSALALSNLGCIRST